MNYRDRGLMAILCGILVVLLLLVIMLQVVEEVEKKPVEEPVVEPKVIEQPIEVEEPEVPEFERVPLGKYRITAYCACQICCGDYALNRPVDENGKVFVAGANGVGLEAGVHCASPLPFGTIVEIENVGIYEVQDRTANWVAEKYDNKIIDIYFDNHEAALEFANNSNSWEEVYKIESVSN